MNAVKEFWSDYLDVRTVEKAFYKKHWKVVVALNVGVVAIFYAPLGVMVLKEKLSERKFAN
jgi:uncharacterized protein YigE (DUF2233 family)